MIWLPTQADQTECAKNSFECMALVQPDKWRVLHTDTSGGILVNRVDNQGRYAVIVSGGAGNGPLFGGYVSGDLADAVVAGGAHAAPNAYAIYEAGKYFGEKREILLLYNNFAGDYLNNDMAQELLRLDNVRAESLLALDDMATAKGESRTERNGRCGIALLIKLAGAYRNMGLTLDKALPCLIHARDRLNTLSLHIDPEKEIATYGAGFSGEPGIYTLRGVSKKAMIQKAADMLIEDLPPEKDEELVLLVNRLRLMSIPDGYISAKTALDYLSSQYKVSHFCVGAFSNITDQYGLDISIMRCDSDTAKLFENKAYGDGFVI